MSCIVCLWCPKSKQANAFDVQEAHPTEGLDQVGRTDLID
jgi:phage FluMu protein Com